MMTELKKLGNYGADKVLSANDDGLKVLINKAYASVIAEAAEKVGAKVVIFANNFRAKHCAQGIS